MCDLLKWCQGLTEKLQNVYVIIRFPICVSFLFILGESNGFLCTYMSSCYTFMIYTAITKVELVCVRTLQSLSSMLIK